MELGDLTKAHNNNDEGRVEVCPENGGFSHHDTRHATEDTSLLANSQGAENNGAQCIGGSIPNDLAGQSSNKPQGNFDRLKNELKEPVCWRVKVWMLILIIFILIILTIFLSIYFCTVHPKDVDDEYNVEEFVVSRSFRGNFTLLNNNLTLEAHLQPNLKQKLTQIYTSSHALARYFFNATVKPLRPGGSGVEYELKFILPKEHQQLIQYTLSKEMVYNVLLQQLLDVDPKDPLYIEPSSLTMEVES